MFAPFSLFYGGMIIFQIFLFKISTRKYRYGKCRDIDPDRVLSCVALVLFWSFDPRIVMALSAESRIIGWENFLVLAREWYTDLVIASVYSRKIANHKKIISRLILSQEHDYCLICGYIVDPFKTVHIIIEFVKSGRVFVEFKQLSYKIIELDVIFILKKIPADASLFIPFIPFAPRFPALIPVWLL